jgi:hypothetical protein
MTNTDKRIAEALKIHWHEWEKKDIDYRRGQARCLNGCSLTRWPETENPDFSTAAGMVLILAEGPKQGWFWKFMQHLEDKTLAVIFKIDMVPFIDWRILIPPILRAELGEFLLKGEKDEQANR